TVDLLDAICGGVSDAGAATTGFACAPGFMMTAAPAQSALSPAVPSLPSTTASIIVFAPVRSTEAGLGPSPRFITSDSNAFLPSTKTAKTTLPGAGGGGGGASARAGAGAVPSSTPTIETKRVADPSRLTVMSASARRGTACGYVTPPSLNV